MQKELKNHLSIRKRCGNLTNRSIELGFKNLDVLTQEIKDQEKKDKEKIKIVQQSISNGWGGFFKVKKNNNKNESNIKQINFEYEKQKTDKLEELYEN